EVVGRVSGGGHDHALAFDLRDRVHVGAESANDLRVLEDGEVVEAVEVNLNRHCPERFGDTRGRSDRIWSASGEVNDIARAGTANGQRPAQRLKDHLLAIRLEAFHDDCGGRQGGVTTELYFDCRCEQ